MILRVMSGRVQPGEIDTVAASLRRDYAPVAAVTPGLRRFVVGARAIDDGGHALAIVTIWADLESAVAAFGGQLAKPQTLDRRDHGVTFDRVDYFEVEAGRTRPEPDAAAFLRVTAGTVARGLDAEIQQQVRSRLPELPEEALEAWVGRRVLGTLVEIAFVSTWSDAPPGVPLDAPIWPSISERYEAFRLELDHVLLSGFGTAEVSGSPAG